MLSVAKILRDQFDDLGRYFGRIGDESFTVILTATPVASAAKLASSLRQAIDAARRRIVGSRQHAQAPARALFSLVPGAAEEALAVIPEHFQTTVARARAGRERRVHGWLTLHDRNPARNSSIC